MGQGADGSDMCDNGNRAGALQATETGPKPMRDRPSLNDENENLSIPGNRLSPHALEQELQTRAEMFMTPAPHCSRRVEHPSCHLPPTEPQHIAQLLGSATANLALLAGRLVQLFGANRLERSIMAKFTRHK